MRQAAWILVVLAAPFAACENEPSSSGPSRPPPPGPECGDCFLSEYCEVGYYCNRTPCQQDCVCTSIVCIGECAGRCTPRIGPYCGDRSCTDPETCDGCAADCGACVCGNATCETTEDCDACPTDCACASCANAIDLPASQTVSITLSDGRDSVDGSCASGNGPEEVIRVTQGAVGGWMEARVDASTFLVSLSVRTICEAAPSEQGCSMQTSTDEQVSVRFYASAGATSYVLVEASQPLSLFGEQATITVYGTF